MTKLIQWVFYPGTVLVSLFCADFLMGQGMSPGLTVAAVSLAFGIFIFLIQFILPHTKRWRVEKHDLKLDLLHAVFSTGLASRLFRILFLSFFVGIAEEMGSHSFWPHHWPVPIQLVLALSAGEFVTYWLHRVSHEGKWMWRLHALHHSPERLYLLSSGRTHPIFVLIGFGSHMALLVLLGAGPEVLALNAVFTGVHGLVQHANIEMKMLPGLNWVFSTPVLHRWHHSRRIEESNSNYGNNLVIWDVVFGTRFCPADRAPSADVGLPTGTRFPETYLGHLASPFIWKDIEAK